MRYGGKIAVVGYGAFLVVFVYWILDKQVLEGSEIVSWGVVISVTLVHAALGFAVARPWVLLLPLLAVAMAVPLGHPSGGEEESLPIWLGLLFYVPPAILVVTIGLGARWLLEGRSR